MVSAMSCHIRVGHTKTITKTSILQRKDFNQLLASVGGNISSLKQELQQDYSGFTLAVDDSQVKPQYYRNPYDISRKGLIDQISRMRCNFFRTSSVSESLIDLEERHRVPVGQMGNYQEVLKKQQPALRELENTPTRLHMFGNPFKVNKQLNIDEAEEAIVIGSSSPQKRKAVQESPPNSPVRKRKPGPLPRDFPYRRSSVSSSSSTPPPSPAPSSDYDSDAEDMPLQIVVGDSEEETSSDLGSDGEETSKSMVNNNKVNNFNSSPSSLFQPPPTSSLNNRSSPSSTPNPHHTNNNSHSPNSHSGDSEDNSEDNHSCLSLSSSASVGSNKSSSILSSSGGVMLSLRDGSSSVRVANNKLSDMMFDGLIADRKDLQVYTFNRQLKLMVTKEVRRPGRDFSKLFKLLSSVRGSTALRIEFVHTIIQEAERFKRYSLVSELEQFLQSINGHHHHNATIVANNTSNTCNNSNNNKIHHTAASSS